MRILFISKDGDSLSLARRVDREGHKALFFIDNPEAQGVGEGLVEKVSSKTPISTKSGQVNKESVKKLLDGTQPNLVVFDMVKLGGVADFISSLGMPVFGGSKWSDLAELNRKYGCELMKAAGINTPSTTYFKSGETEKAIDFIHRAKGRLVYKPSGNIDTSHTYVGQGKDDLISMLRLWKSDHCDFELQEFIEGVEVSAELWWNGFTSTLHNWTMEEKGFMNGNVGSATGCMGNVVCRCKKGTRLISEGVGKMERLLKKTNYKGALDLNCIVKEDKLYGLEFTARFGYDALQALLTLYRGSLSKLFFDIAEGKRPEEDFFLETSIAVRLSIPPYPSDGKPEHLPIIGVSPLNEKHIWFGDVHLTQGKKLECSGFDGMLGCVTAKGKNVRECQRRAYRTIHSLTIPQLQYRTDIGERVNKDLARLKDWGWV